MAVQAEGWPWVGHNCDVTVTPSEIAPGSKAVLTCTGDPGYATLSDGTGDPKEIELPYTVDVSPKETTEYTLIINGVGRRWRDRWAVQDTSTLKVATPPVPPVPPLPPLPPTPTKGLNVLICGPGPKAVHDLTPDQVAILTSRTLRDWLEGSCEKDESGLPAFRILAKGTTGLSPRWAAMVALAPADKVSLVNKMGDKVQVLDLPANAAKTLKVLSEFVGKPAAFKPVRFAPVLKVPTIQQFAAGPRGTRARDLKTRPRGAGLREAGIALIPRSEWPTRVAALKDANAGLMALCYGHVPDNDQSSTNYCWANGPVSGAMHLRYAQGESPIYLSAASVAGPLSNYRNEGGWGLDAVKFLVSTGCVRDSLWPNAAINRAYASKPEVKADYPRHKLLSANLDLGATGKMFDEVATCVLLGAPVPVGYDWWGHEVVAVGLTLLNASGRTGATTKHPDQPFKWPQYQILSVGATFSDGRWGLILRNSWGDSWDGGDKGYFVLPEGTRSNQGTPNDAQAMLMMTAGSDGASLEPLGKSIRAIIEVPVSVDVCPDGKCDTCPNGNCGSKRRGR
jgi:hypothetical protein